MITDYFMITEKGNRIQVIVITDYDYSISGICCYIGYQNFIKDPISHVLLPALAHVLLLSCR